MKFSVGTLLWLIAVFAAFMLGLTINTIGEPVTPVLIAAHNVDANKLLVDDDFRVVRRRASTVPFGVLTNKSQIAPRGLSRRLRAGQYIFPEDIKDYSVQPSVPNGYILQAMNLNHEDHNLINHLLSVGDRVSIHGVTTGADGKEKSEVVADCVTVYSVYALENRTQLYVIATTSESEQMGKMTDNGRLANLRIAPPITANGKMLRRNIYPETTRGLAE